MQLSAQTHLMLNSNLIECTPAVARSASMTIASTSHHLCSYVCVCVVGWPKMCVFRPVLGASGLVGSSRQRKVTVCPRKQRLQVISFISMPKLQLKTNRSRPQLSHRKNNCESKPPTQSPSKKHKNIASRADHIRSGHSVN